MPDFLPQLQRLKEEQQRVLAAKRKEFADRNEEVPTTVEGEKWETVTLRNGVEIGKVWNNEEAGEFIKSFIAPWVRCGNWWPWAEAAPSKRPEREEVERAVASDLITRMVCYLSWHANLVEAAASEDPAGALRKKMWKWFGFQQGEIYKSIKIERKRVPGTIDPGPEDDDGKTKPNQVGSSAPARTDDADGWKNLLNDWLEELARADERPRLNPSTPPSAAEARNGVRPTYTALFFEWSLWQGRLPLIPAARPVNLSEFDLWTQEAYAAWRGLENRRVSETVSEKNRTTGERQGLQPLFKGFCQRKVSEGETTWEELHAGFVPYLHVTFVHWVPEFVDTSAFVIRDAGPVAAPTPSTTQSP